ncbi:SET domain-containing 3 [Fusarium albosuccineum]|uniref:SET domain-containing 3 n=1 Tax=Fusarium albosuccineum TaxID=1237068 RepID=A0A8H4L806_9HYPO|nr:SET domain-containing 3 [Fusarium albosuccineum]
MTDKTAPLSTQSAAPSQTSPPVQPGATLKDDVARKVETAEEEPYTIKCICNFSDDDGNTIYCETCDTWQHIDCFYPDNREEAIREDFAHSCAECKPRPLDRQKAIERTLRLKNAANENGPTDKRTKRPPSKSHKKRSKPNDLQINGHTSPQENPKHGPSTDNPHPPRKAKSSHRSSQSVSSQAPKRSPSYGNARSNPVHPPSPATTPPDLPEDFQIHHYSQGFYDLYNARDVPVSHNNAFASLAIPTALSRWLRSDEMMKSEVGRQHSDVFQTAPADLEAKKPKLDIKDATRTLGDGKSLRWRFLNSATPIEKDVPLVELNGEIGFQKDYCADPANLWADLSSPLPFVFFHPILPLYIDTRQEGSLARYVRRSCKPNAQLDTYLSGGSEYHFWIVSERYISANEQITLPWDFRLEKSVDARWLHLLGLSDDETPSNSETPVDETEYMAISNWIDRILSEYGGCACDLDNNCAFARFHRQYLFGKTQVRAAPKKKQRKPKAQAISPTSTGQTANSRATSEGHLDDGADQDSRSQSGSTRSKPPSRDLTPLRQGSFDQLGILTEPTDRDKRKVAMVEDTFRRMEQQQPPRKKKRVSDGNTSNSSRSKPRNGSITSHGNYVDSGTCRSKSGSPASSHSPQLSHKPSTAKQESSISRSRQSSTAPRGVYCDAAVQTDPVEGEWYSEPNRSPRPKKRIISLSKRLLNNRHKVRTEDGDQRRQSLATQGSNGTIMDIDSPILDHTPAIKRSDSELPSPCSQAGDVPMTDALSAATTPVLGSAASDTSTKTKTPDLRVQLPPVPAFDSTGLGIQNVTTPQSGAMVQSPLSGSLPSPFAPPAVNGIAAHPSPIKKKLSLSDYTKSRMNKAASKTAGGNALLKPTMSSPEDARVDIIIESPSVEKSVGSLAPTIPAATTNGSL